MTSRLAHADHKLADGADLLANARRLPTGPSDYLVLGANNARCAAVAACR